MVTQAGDRLLISPKLLAIKNKLNIGVKPVKGKALCLSEDEKKHSALAKAYWQSCRDRIQLYQKLENEKWIFYQ